MADTSQALVLDALTRAAAEPDGLPLLGGKNAPGLFATNPAGKQAAQHTKSAGLLRVLRTETRGKGVQEICALTDKGLALLLEHTNPRLVLEAFVNALKAAHLQMDMLRASVHASQEHLLSLKSHAERVLDHLERPQLAPGKNNGKHEADAAAPLLAHLKGRHDAGTLDDCSLPELYRLVQCAHPGLTIGQFHDLLRQLCQDAALYLHPWTGPLYELPEPACALLVGHEVAYYASLRVPLAA